MRAAANRSWPSTAISQRSAVLGGTGPALLVDWLIDSDIAAGRLIDLFSGHAVTATTFDTAAWLIYPIRAYLPLKVRSTIDFLRTHVCKPQLSSGLQSRKEQDQTEN